MARAVVSVLLLSSVQACGARSGLLMDETLDGAFQSGDALLEAGDGGDVDADADSKKDSAQTCASDAQCNDGVACTIDSCDTATGTCAHHPDDARCAPGFTCQSPDGCVATAFAVDSTTLYGITLPAGTAQAIGPTSGHSLTDVALGARGNLFGVSDKFLYALDPKTGAASRIAEMAGFPTALGFGPDGTLYVAAEHDAVAANGVFMVNPDTGAETFVVDFPFGYVASGDLAVIGRTLYATVAGGTEDVLVSIDLDTGDGSVEGPIGFGCVWGLAAQEGVLFGFTCNGQVIRFDGVSPKATLVSTPGPAFTGAAAR
jgi:hypothetical protein